MLKINYIKQTVTLYAVFFALGCSKDSEPKQIHEEEVITRVTLSVKKEGSSTPVLYHRNDHHEDAQDEPRIALDSHSTYEVEVSFYNTSNPSDIKNITEEVQEEADEHQVFYEIIRLSGIAITASADDIKDSSGKPVFLKTVWKTSAPTMGEIKVYLIHEPTSKTGSTPAEIGGETDVEVDFYVEVE